MHNARTRLTAIQSADPAEQRRGWLIMILAIGFIGASLLFIPIALLLQQDPSVSLEMILIALVLFIAAIWLVQRGKLTLGVWLIMVALILGPTESIVGQHIIGPTPFALMLPIIAASVLLPPRQIWLVLCIALAALIGALALLPPAMLEGEFHRSILITSVLFLPMAALISFLGAHVTQTSLRAMTQARHEAEFTAARLAQLNLELEQRVSDYTWAEEARQRVVRENQQLVTAIASLEVGVTISDATGVDHPLVFVNRGFTAITGYSAEEVLGRNCRFLQGPETDPQTVQAIRAALAAQTPITTVLRNYRKDGTPFWNELTINPIFDADGTLIGFVGIQVDVTGRVEAEEALRASEARFRAVWEQATDAMALSDEAGVVQLVNPAYCRLYGFAIDEIIGQSFVCIFPETARQDALTAYRQTFQHASSGQCFEATVQRADGATRVVESRIDFLLHDGKRAAMLSVVRDITERKQMEEDLRRLNDELEQRVAERTAELAATNTQLRVSQHFIQRVTAMNPALIYVYNLADQQTIYTNHQGLGILGYTMNELHGLRPGINSQLLHPDDHDAFRNWTEHLHQLQGGEIAEHEYRIRHQGGAWRWIAIREAVFLRDADDRPVQMLGAALDITEHKEAEAAPGVGAQTAGSAEAGEPWRACRRHCPRLQ